MVDLSPTTSSSSISKSISHRRPIVVVCLAAIAALATVMLVLVAASSPRHRQEHISIPVGWFYDPARQQHSSLVHFLISPRSFSSLRRSSRSSSSSIHDNTNIRASSLLWSLGQHHQQENHNKTNLEKNSRQQPLHLLTTLCRDKCQQHSNDNNDDDCRHYQTPMNTCFHGATMFPGDPSWNDPINDIIDVPVNQTHFHRNFYEAGASCKDDRDGGFVLPYQTCVGPFGAPRPWGIFRLLES